MNAMTPLAKTPRVGRPAKPAPAPLPPAPARVAPSAPQLFALRKLERAPENVRHHRIDEDVTGLADDIAAHGLLQSLIGYRHHDRVRIVGGGRRLQALDMLVARKVLDSGWQVPVLIRDPAEAVELSLAENLQQRTMSPVDQFLGFKALIDSGRHSPAGLAARFGFSERVVRQRLRLADLAAPILDALAERTITLDAAMAYAKTQDRQLQEEIFAIEQRRTHNPHRPSTISYSVTSRGMKIDDPVMRFLGVDRYEAAGGGYEDTLFVDAADADRIVARPMLAQSLAIALIDQRMTDMIATACEVEDFAPTITGYVIAPGLRLQPWGNEDAKAPPGRTRIDRADQTSLWRDIRDHRIDVLLLVGIDAAGELVIHPRTVFAPMAARKILCAPASGRASDEEIEEARKEREVLLWSRRLAVGPFEDTPFDGRTYWPEQHSDRTYAGTRDGIPGQYVHLHIFAPDALVAEKRRQAERRVDKARSERAALDAKVPAVPNAEAATA